MIYGNYNEIGEYIGFYRDDIHDVIPEPNIKLEEKEWQEAIQGNYMVINGVHVKFKEIGLSDERKLDAIRAERNDLLSKSDWSQFNDVTLSETDKSKWITYRQELRDFMVNCDINNPLYPVAPNK